MKNKNLITLCVSLLTTLGLVSCGAAESNSVNEPPIEVFMEPDIVSHNMKINRLATGTDANDHEYQTFGFTVLPTNSYYREVSATITFADNRNNGSQYLTATVDNSNCTVTVTMLQLFDSVATLRLTTAKASVYADVTVRLNPRYSFTCSIDGFSSDYHETGLVGSSTKNLLDFKSRFLAESFISMSDNTEVSVNPYQASLPSFSGTPSIDLTDFGASNYDSQSGVWSMPWHNYITLYNSEDGMGGFNYNGVKFACYCLLRYFNDSFDSNFVSTSDFFDSDYLEDLYEEFYDFEHGSGSYQQYQTSADMLYGVYIQGLQDYSRANNGYLHFDIDINALPFTFAFSGVSFIEVGYTQEGLMPVTVDIWNPSLTISSSESSITF